MSGFKWYSLVLILVLSHSLMGQEMAVRGFCIGAPGKADVESFAHFIDTVLGPRGVNTLILRIDYNFAFHSHPELQDENPLIREDIITIREACGKHQIDIIPQINLLGHQSWHSDPGNLLQVYPQFDETPHVALPANYEWPNEDGLYCKSYCPLHPMVHSIVFDLVDEICEVFGSTAFHAGMDEVFYLGDDQCPRCAGRDKAELFAGEVSRIRNHLARSGRELWIWGDRLIDGKTTGIGMWEASMNNTYRAVDMIPKDVVICDWHYERAEPTAAYFAMKGFRIITCPWRDADVALKQLEGWKSFQQNANPAMTTRYLGMMQTIWSSAGGFMNNWIEDAGQARDDETLSPVWCFDELSQEW